MDHLSFKPKQQSDYKGFPIAMESMLLAFQGPIEAEGSAIITFDDRDNTALVAFETHKSPPGLLAAIDFLRAAASTPNHGLSDSVHPILAGPWQSPLAKRSVLLFWRAKEGKPWKRHDHAFVEIAAIALNAVSGHMATEHLETASDSVVDVLTGLPKARKFAGDLPRYFSRLDREGLPGTLIVANIDDFSLIKERYGRKVGDEVLRQTAKLLGRVSRPTDVISRIGSNEFAIWLQGADHFTAAERAEQLRIVTPHAMAAALGDQGPSVTLSIGIVARRPGSQESVRTLLMRADYALHEAKKAGQGLWRVARDEVV